MRWLLLGLAGAAVFLYGRITGDAQLSLLTKGIPVIALLLALIAGGAMFAILASSGLGELLIPVACYATAICLMLWRALARIGHPHLQPRSTWLAAGGAALFVLSDSLIGIDRFVASFDAAPYAIILTYWLGQWGIAASAFQRVKA